MPVDRFELVRQRVHARDGKPETGIELVGDAERIGLEAEMQKPPVAVVGKSGVGDGQIRDIVRSQRNPAELPRLLADEARNPDAGPRLSGRSPPASAR